MRQSVAALRLAPTDRTTLLESVHGLVQECQATGIAARLEVRGTPRPLGPAIERVLYRVVQEGLTNVRKHAQADQVTLTLSYDGCDAVCCVIADNGVGAAAVRCGFGLLGMRERVQAVGGTVQVISAPAEGFCIWVEVPLCHGYAS